MWFSYWLRCDWRGKKRPRVYRWSERNKPPSLGERRWREDISVGWLKLSMSCFTSYLPSPVLSFPLSGVFTTHRRRALPTRLRCQSEAYLPSRLFKSSLPLFSCFCPTRSLFSFWQSTLCLASCFPLCIIDLTKRSRLFHLLVPDGSHPTRKFCNTENEVA